MFHSKKNNLIAASILAVAIVLSTALFVSVSDKPGMAARGMVTDILLLLVLSVAVMVSELHASMKETLYSYRNIGLTGGILFSSVLTVVMLTHFVRVLFEDDYPMEKIYRAFLTFPRSFSYWAIFIVIGVCLALGVSNIALIRHEGFRPKNALSIVLAVFYLGGTLAVWSVSGFLSERVFAGGNRVLTVLDNVLPLFLLLLLCYFECIFVGATVMEWIAVHTEPKHDKDFIIILGCLIDKKGGLLPLLKGRVNRAMRFAWTQEIDTGKAAKYVPSGGKGPTEVMSEGSAMELYLKTKGAEDYEVFPERESRDTWENMLFSKRIIDGMDPNAKIAFATTNYHILRAGILARKAGMDAEGIAGDTKWYFWPNGYIREFFGILTLNLRAHLWFAAAAGVFCAVLGVVGMLAQFI